MTRIRIRHESVYTWQAPVNLGLWRLLMRPQDTHATRLLDAALETPPGDIKWFYDAYGNSVCTLAPYAQADRLTVVNQLLVERYPAQLDLQSLADLSLATPITYGMDDRVVLEPYIKPATADCDPGYVDWMQRHLPQPGELAVGFLQRINASIHQEFAYNARNAYGTQSPNQTLAYGSGTCRDFAWLMIESMRRWGFAARFATGYLHSPGAQVRGAGATHAWCEVFLPDHGWIEFDPTNGLAESSSLIRIAATRTWWEASPMNGGPPPELPCQLDVAVTVEAVDDAALSSAA